MESDAGSRGSAAEFYSALAPEYEGQFDVPHRKAYDTLCRESVFRALQPGSFVVDVGCGVGRWATDLVTAGHRVLGIEPSPAMAAQAARLCVSERFELQEADVDHAQVKAGSADVVLAMGSVQYAPEPCQSIATMASWLRPGGRLWVLVDSQQALIQELLRRGDYEEAAERASVPIANLSYGSLVVEHHLFTSATIRAALESAGLVEVEVSGLLVAWSSVPRGDAQTELSSRWTERLGVERDLSRVPELADHGKQLLATGIAAPWAGGTAARPGDI